jgi:thiosulfate/3-mercaptopyruvate sulfurtransferase
MINARVIASILLMAALFAVATSCVNGECSACKGGSITAQQEVLNKEWAVFLGEENDSARSETVPASTGLVTPQYPRQQAGKSPGSSQEDDTITASQAGAEGLAEGNSFRTLPGQEDLKKRSDRFASVLVPLEMAGDSGIIVDISPDPAEYIPGAISIPYTQFLHSDGTLKTVPEMAGILGGAGISESDPVLIYGECQPCGGGPSAATYVYWIMKYLGHEHARLLDASIDDWVAAGNPTKTSPSSLPSKIYTATINAGLLATYDYVRGGTAQIIDARSPAEYEFGSIPSSINIPYDRVLDGKKIKDDAALRDLFSSLDKNKTAVIYTNTGVKASMIWLALSLLDYDAKIYSWKDWQANLPHLNITLRNAYATPNPARIGDVVQITAVFGEKNNGSVIAPVSGGQGGNQTRLTIKGCATCGFGSPQGFADLGSSNGTIQIGSSTQIEKSVQDSGFSVSALVMSPSGERVSRVPMKRIRSDGDEFSGVWKADVASAVYRIDIVATSGGNAETFGDATRIEVSGTSKYKNLEHE